MSLLSRANLLTRIVILVAVATLPAAAVLAYLQHDLRASRHERLSAEVLRQAELVSGDLGNVVAGARQLAVAISHYRNDALLEPVCASTLVALQADLPAYGVLAVLREDGSPICSTLQGAEGLAAPSVLAMARRSTATQGFEVGAYLPAGPGHGALLPFTLGFTAAGGERGVVVVGLGLDWLARHLRQIRRPADMTLLVGDRTGTVIAADPAPEQFLGRALPGRLAERLDEPVAGTIVVTGADGGQRLVGFVPQSVPLDGLFVAVGQRMADLVADIDRATWQGSLLMFVGAVLSLWLALLVGDRFVRRPAAGLMEAARRWTDGDLQARAELGEPPSSEFGRLAVAFNTMAEALGAQRAELEALNATLQARAEERSRDLLESRNRLQVETAERERTEGELRQAQKLQAVGQLAGGIAHDFNNLLTAITGALELLRRRLGGEASSLHLVEHALAAAERGGKLTGQLLSFSRRQRLLPAPTDVNASLGGLNTLIAGAVGRAIRVRSALAPGLWPVMVDPNQFEAAILNLAINARDAMAESGGELSITTANVCVPQDLPVGPGMAPGDYVAITVADTGSGMTDDVRGRAFEPFFTTKAPGAGSGLGLSQVHGLAIQSGGDARITSTAGAGTRVMLLLPRATVAAVPAMPSAGARGGQPSRRVHILVVDDDQPVREMIAALLVERGHRVSTAEDGPAGLVALESDLESTGGSIEILLADFVMPGMNGLALIQAARAMRPGLKAMLVTGHAEFRAGDSIRPEDVMRKPFTLAQLDARIEALLARAVQPMEAGA